MVVERRRHRRTAGAAAAMRMARPHRVDAGDGPDLRSAGHGHRTAVMAAEVEVGGGARGKADAEQPLAPVDGQVEGVAEHVAGGEHSLDVR